MSDYGVIESESSESEAQAATESLGDLSERLLAAISDSRSFSSLIYELVVVESVRGISRELFLLSRKDENIRRQFSSCYKELRRDLARTPPGELRDRLLRGYLVLESLGLGEVVFVTPEGHHAKAGGLAQVITGLSEALVDQGMSVSIISPIYEEAQGNQHKSAESLIAEGVVIDGTHCRLVETSAVNIRICPSPISGDKFLQEPPRHETCRVYQAGSGQLRLFFLRHAQLANKLYPRGNAKTALERAVFLSRGALKILTSRTFDVVPHILVTNDWMTGLLPVFLAADPEFQSAFPPSMAKTVHVIHNCGKAYQGRYPVNMSGEDLWPLLGLSDEHYFGLADPDDGSVLNLTGGALFHVKDAILAVSKPYAEQLLTKSGGDGLEDILKRQEQRLFGISNGVDLNDLRRTLWEFGEAARARFDMRPLHTGEFSERSFLRHLPKYKEVSKRIAQNAFGFTEHKNAVFCSLVSRLTEQKGIDLLVAPPTPGGRSLLEELLRNTQLLQIFIAGPLSDGDASADRLQNEVQRLTEVFPGRIRGVFDFLPHSRVLEIAAASDLLLMPSRYEPGGISQLEALAAGTLVVARNVGGIAATLVNFDERTGEGNSFLFEDYSSSALGGAVMRALGSIQETKVRRKLFRRAVLAANDWSHRVPKYRALFQYIAGVLRENEKYPFLQPQCALVETLRPNPSDLHGPQ